MDDSTTPGNGAAPAAQPVEPEAVSLGEAGAPVLRPKVAPTSTPQSQLTEEPAAPTAPEEPQAPEGQPEAQATPPEEQQLSNDELQSWLQKKGLEINFDNPNEVKLANMQFNAEKRMHEATAAKPQIDPPEMQDFTGNDAVDEVINRQNVIEQNMYVRDWFEAHPEAKDFRTQLRDIAAERPWLTNMDDVYAHLQSNPDFQSRLKREGGREALTNLAQKQANIPPTASASSGASSSQEKITPDNVDAVVAAHMGDAKWYAAHKSEVDRAMAGTR